MEIEKIVKFDFFLSNEYRILTQKCNLRYQNFRKYIAKVVRRVQVSYLKD